MNANEFLVAVKDDILNDFRKVDKKYFDFELPFFLDPIGKGIRTRYCYYLASILGVDLNKAIKIAASAEIIHLASLLHDDCIDGSMLRRGMPTLNSMFGISVAVLVGDMIVSFAFEKAKSLSPEICYSLVDCVRKMSEGALFEEKLKFKIISEDEYNHIVMLKTSEIFRWIGISLVFLSKKDKFYQIEKISKNFGISFQIIDDVIDFEGDSSSVGKDTFKDLVEGKLTYPVILAMNENGLRNNLLEYFENRDASKLVDIRNYLLKNDILYKSREKAKALIEEVKDEIIYMGDYEKTIDFYNYLYSLVTRRR